MHLLLLLMDETENYKYWPVEMKRPGYAVDGTRLWGEIPITGQSGTSKLHFVT